MFIVPYIYKVTKENNVQVHTIQLLTVGGRTLWEEDASLDLDHDILEPNDLYRKGEVKKIGQNLLLCEVDTEKTNIHDFYQWKEIPIDDDATFCWKPYFYLLGEKEDSWLPVPRQEKIGHHSVHSMIEHIIQST